MKERLAQLEKKEIEPLPDFPDFRPVTFEDKSIFDRYAAENDYQHCDFNFVGFWIWDVDASSMVSQLNDNLVVNYRDPKSTKRYVSYLGKNRPIETISGLLEFAESDPEYLDELLLVPDINLEGEALAEAQRLFRVEEDRDYFDYLYDLAELSKLEGRQYRSKRNAISKFQRQNEGKDIHFGLINLDSLDMQSKVLELAKKTNTTDLEMRALRRLLEAPKCQHIFAKGVFFEDQLGAFEINSLAENGLVFGHFSKANREHYGLQEYVHHGSSVILSELSFGVLNAEYDYGFDGLRQSKLSWRPHELLKKFRISRISALHE